MRRAVGAELHGPMIRALRRGARMAGVVGGEVPRTPPGEWRLDKKRRFAFFDGIRPRVGVSSGCPGGTMDISRGQATAGSAAPGAGLVGVSVLEGEWP